MMTRLKTLSIAVIGTRDQTALLRLAGVEKYHIIEDDEPDIQGKLKDITRRYSNDPSIGIIIMPDQWMEYIAEVKQEILRRKATIPIIVGMPSPSGTEKENIKAFYKAYTKKLIGFNIEI